MFVPPAALADDSTGKLYLKLVHYQGAYCLTTEGGVLHLTPECSMDEAQQFHFSSISAASDANDLRSVPLVSSPCSGPGCLVGCPNLPDCLLSTACLPAFYIPDYIPDNIPDCRHLPAFLSACLIAPDSWTYTSIPSTHSVVAAC